MKRFSAIAIGIASCIALSIPTTTYAMRFEWLPKLFELHNPYRNQHISQKKSMHCKARNSFGTCVAYGKHPYLFRFSNSD